MSQARYTPAENRRAVKKHYDDNTEEVLKSKVIKRILQGKIPQKRSLEKYEIDQGVLNEIRAEANLPPVTLHKYTPPTIQSEDSDTDTPPVIQVQDESDSESVPPARTPSPEPEPQAPRTPSPPPPVSATKVRVAKMFDGKLFFGFGFKTPGDKFYTIEYDDGDSEEMNSTEFRKHAALAKRKAKDDPEDKAPLPPPTPGVVTLDEIEANYEKKVEDGEITAGTFKTHFKNFKNLLAKSGCKDRNVITCLKTKNILKYIKDNYSNKNTVHTYLTAVLNVIDTNTRLKDALASVRSHYLKAWEKSKEEKEEDNIERRLTEDVESFDKIKNRIVKAHSATSDESLMINLYDQITPRDDFNNVTFDTKDPNHINLTNGTITIRDFKKTGKKYDPIVNFKLSKTFLTNLKKSLKEFPRDKLFTKSTSSIFRSAKTGVQAIRKGKISEILDGENVRDKDKREELRKTMMHSAATQLTYIRKLRK